MDGVIVSSAGRDQELRSVGPMESCIARSLQTKYRDRAVWTVVTQLPVVVGGYYLYDVIAAPQISNHPPNLHLCEMSRIRTGRKSNPQLTTRALFWSSLASEK